MYVEIYPPEEGEDYGVVVRNIIEEAAKVSMDDVRREHDRSSVYAHHVYSEDNYIIGICKALLELYDGDVDRLERDLLEGGFSEREVEVIVDLDVERLSKGDKFKIRSDLVSFASEVEENCLEDS